MNAYDLIGDIHGRADELETLLGLLGYEKRSGSYGHSERTAIFLGDLIDGGTQNRQVINIVRSMVDSGSALAVMGNHEYNAICYHTRHPEKTGEYLRSQDGNNEKQHKDFLDEYKSGSGKDDALAWFRQLPLFLDLGPLRVVHACWHPEKIEELNTFSPANRLNDDFLVASTRRGSKEWEIVEMLLKGTEEKLPPGFSFLDEGGHERKEIRTKWWQPDVKTFRDAAVLTGEELQRVPDAPFPAETIIGYPTEAAPVFFGHYWLQGAPAVFRDNIACLDYSVAKPGGSLCSYRWNGESRLSNENFVSVPRKE